MYVRMCVCIYIYICVCVCVCVGCGVVWLSNYKIKNPTLHYTIRCGAIQFTITYIVVCLCHFAGDYDVV